MTLKEARHQYFHKMRLLQLSKLLDRLKEKADHTEALEAALEETKDLIKDLEKSQNGTNNRMEPIDIHPLVDEAGKLVSDDVLLLKRMSEDEYPMYHQLFIENEFGSEDNVIEAIFKSNLTDNCLYCTIFLQDFHEPIGYCGIKNAKQDPPELAIELLKAYQHQGYGYRAMQLYLDALTKADIHAYTAVVDPDNLASQNLFFKLNATLTGITDYMLYTEKDQQEFEHLFSELLSPHLQDLAEQLGVEPRKLLSHALLFRLDWE